ncbi:hypothetical protein [Paraburkholderia mimosarum]|uniref:hypothetical protein n=1 Tax=Paraburkholderia mimosarum TaxID=312026 RepID=UPI0012B6705C|nr:hypothetical protein [Paraburkholderia mimosarum]
MNCNTKIRRHALALATVGILFGVASQEVLADGQDTVIVPPQQTVDGMTYNQWSAAWWQWLLAIPYGPPRPNPSGYNDGTHCSVNQSGPVWFLTGPSGSLAAKPAIEQCKVPAGKYIFVPIINADCSTYELPAGAFSSSNPTGPGCSVESDCRVCAKNIINLVTSVSATIDNIPVSGVQPPSSPFRVQSPFFQFSVPHNNFFVTDSPPLSGAGSGMAISDGYWLMIKPLPLGPHTIHVIGSIPGVFTEDVTFNITVSQP